MSVVSCSGATRRCFCRVSHSIDGAADLASMAGLHWPAWRWYILNGDDAASAFDQRPLLLNRAARFCPLSDVRSDACLSSHTISPSVTNSMTAAIGTRPTAARRLSYKLHIPLFHRLAFRQDNLHFAINGSGKQIETKRIQKYKLH